MTPSVVQAWNTKYILLNEKNIKKLYRKYRLETNSRPSPIFYKSSLKKESDEVSELIWTNFESFA